jgi:D-methionine transport system substrate-binding protein
MRKKTNKLMVLGVIAALMMSLSLSACGDKKPADPAPIATQLVTNPVVVVGATAKPHAEILEVIKPLVAEQGVELVIQTFTDYVLLNPSLKDGQLNANFFQHTPYLDDYNINNNADLVPLVKVHNEPMGIYSRTQTSLEDIADGSVVGIPNDTTNGGRALMVLEAAGLITLKDGAGISAITNDIVDNPHNLKITMMDAAMLPRALEDTAFCVINSNYALEANLNPVQDSLFMEPKDSPFANILVVRAEDKEDANLAIVARALQSQAVYDFLVQTYDGSCVPAFDPAA